MQIFNKNERIIRTFIARHAENFFLTIKSFNMKIKKSFCLIVAIFLLGACSDDLMNSIPLIEINPGFSNPGFNDANLISLNESETYAVSYNRVYGISRELTMAITVDQESLNSYNQENGTNYKLLPAEYYSMPESVTFDEKSKNANFDIILYSKKIYEANGTVEASSEYVLPLKATTNETKGVDVKESENMLLVHVNMQPSSISVPTPGQPSNLYFAKDSETKEAFSITGSLNFNGINPEALSLVVDTQAPLLNTGEYTLLPEANYTFGEATDSQAGYIEIGGEINAIGLSEENTYILPCRLQSSNADYVIKQEEPMYYVINISELNVSILDGSETEAVSVASSLTTLNGYINVTANTIVSSDLTTNFNYDPSLIDAFNTSTGQDFQTLPEGSVSIPGGKIGEGTKLTTMPYSIDLSGLELNSSVHYLVPLVLSQDDLEMGTISGSQVIYLDVTKSLVGTYNLNVIQNDRTRNIGNTIWNASDCQRAGDAAWDAAIAQAQYGFGGDGDWYAVLFSVTDEDMPGKENCKKIEIYSFLELIESTGGSNNVTENKSYFNTVTGEVYIDCFVYESWFDASYKETYSFTLQ